MARVMSGLAMAGLLFGCGASAVGNPDTAGPLADTSFGSYAAGDQAPPPATDEEAGFSTETDFSGLPAAPWATARLAETEVPAPILSAWTHADNRGVCAPLVPLDLGDASGAEPRVANLVEGGWSVEFDRRGLPGSTAEGETCARCGRGVVGIAGTAMSPDEVLLANADTIEPSFDDGSHLTVDAPEDGERVVVATLALRDQACVYQVWSYLGEAHLREVVSGLRRVNLDTPTVAAR